MGTTMKDDALDAVPCAPMDVWAACRRAYEVDRLSFKAISREFRAKHPEITVEALRERKRSEGWTMRVLSRGAPAAQASVSIEVSTPAPAGTMTSADEVLLANLADDYRELRRMARRTLDGMKPAVDALHGFKALLVSEGDPREVQIANLLNVRASLELAAGIAGTLERLVRTLRHDRTGYMLARQLEAATGSVKITATSGATAGDDDESDDDLARDLACLDPAQLAAAIEKAPEGLRARVRALTDGTNGGNA